LKNHEWTLMNTNLRTRTIIQPVAPQSLNDGREFRRKGTPILSQSSPLMEHEPNSSIQSVECRMQIAQQTDR
jgi:hypothetical protein